MTSQSAGAGKAVIGQGKSTLVGACNNVARFVNVEWPQRMNRIFAHLTSFWRGKKAKDVNKIRIFFFISPQKVQYRNVV